MALSPSLFIVCLLVIPGLASPPQALSLASPDLPQLLPASNLTTLPELNASSSENDLTIRCGEEFGVNPNTQDCSEAGAVMLRHDEEWAWGPRHTGLAPDVIPLPLRQMGERALCFLEVNLVRNEAGVGHASTSQVIVAFSALMVQCSIGRRSGGIAKNIGGDNNLAVTLGVYHPAVRCRGTFGPEWESCGAILGDMPAGKGRMIFGPRSLPEPRQELPRAIQSDECLVTIYTNGKRDLSSWYNIWEAVNAVYSVCARYGRGGGQTGLGDAGNIFLTMKSTAGGTATGSHLSSLPMNVSIDATK